MIGTKGMGKEREESITGRRKHTEMGRKGESKEIPEQIRGEKGKKGKKS